MPTQLFISILKKAKSKFLLTNSKTFMLNNLEITDKSLFNLSQIYIHLKQYFQEQKLKKVKAIICSPSLSEINEPIKNLFLLQQILVCCKAGITIEKIIGKSQWQKGSNMTPLNFLQKKEINNQLNFFKRFLPPKNKSPYKWLIATALITTFLITVQVKLFTQQKEKLLISNKKVNELKVENESLENQLKQIQLIQSENKKLEIRKNRIIKKQNNKNLLNNILLSISNTIPNNCWLEHLKISHNSTSKKQKSILLEGKAFNEKEILRFTDHLHKTSQLDLLKIESIKKDKIKLKNAIKPYSFKITGVFKPKTSKKECFVQI